SVSRFFWRVAKVGFSWRRRCTSASKSSAAVATAGLAPEERARIGKDRRAPRTRGSIVLRMNVSFPSPCVLGCGTELDSSAVSSGPGAKGNEKEAALPSSAMRPRVFLDGSVGTTGLRIRELLAGRSDLEVSALPEAARKDPAARRAALRAADFAILCLPDDAAREAAVWVADAPTRLIDASTAHRVVEGWVYGLPELAPGQREAIAAAKQVANPGCWPTGFLLLVRPLLDAGLV